MGEETKIEGEACRRLEADWGVLNLKLTSAGSTGWPDRLFFIPGGRPVLVEFKRPGEKPRPKQAYQVELLRGLRYDVQVHDDADAAVRAVVAALRAAIARMKREGKPWRPERK